MSEVRPVEPLDEVATMLEQAHATADLLFAVVAAGNIDDLDDETVSTVLASMLMQLDAAQKCLAAVQACPLAT